MNNVANSLISLQIKTLELNCDTTIPVKMNISDHSLRLIIDTGAQTSILKTNKLKHNTLIRNKDRMSFKGILVQNHVNAIGSVITKTLINNISFEHKFYVISDNINLTCDGIIGHDFLKTFGAKINYFKNTVKFQIPIHTQIKVKALESENIPNVNILPHNQLENLKETTDQGKYEKPTEVNNDQRIDINEINGNKQKTVSTELNELFNDLQETIRKNILINEKRKNEEQEPEMKEQIKKKRVNNKDFYKNLPIDYFENKNNYKTIEIQPTIIEKDIKETHENREIPENFLYINKIQTAPQLNRPHNENRAEYLMQNINLSHCKEEEIKMMKQIFKQYNNAFQIEGDTFEHTNISKHEINLKPNASPIHIRQFRIPEHHKAEIQKQLDELEHKGIISKCESPWNSPIFLVPKKDNDLGEKQFRLVIDYRKLNSVIEPTSYPMPLIDEILDQMKNSKIFTTLDLYGAFHQIPLEEKSKQYTAFSTSWEKYCFNSVPFGLVSSPYAWLKAILMVLKGLIGKNIFVYMDDIIIFSRDLEHHTELLSEVLKRLSKYKLKLKIDKSKFLRDRVT